VRIDPAALPNKTGTTAIALDPVRLANVSNNANRLLSYNGNRDVRRSPRRTRGVGAGPVRGQRGCRSAASAASIEQLVAGAHGGIKLQVQRPRLLPNASSTCRSCRSASARKMPCNRSTTRRGCAVGPPG
jgi:hypothetical protein